MTQALLDAIVIAPSQLQFLQGVAATIVQIMEKNDKKEADIVKKVFQKRNLLVNHKVEEIAAIITTEITPSAEGTHFMNVTIGASVNNPSQKVKIELPKLISLAPEENIYDSLKKNVDNFINYMSVENLLGEEADNAMFVIKEDKLVRNYICSSFKSLPQIATKKNIIGDIV